MEALDAIRSGDFTLYTRYKPEHPPAQACYEAVRGNNWHIFKHLLDRGMQLRVWRSVHRLSTPLQLAASNRNIDSRILVALMQDYWDVRNWQGETASDIARRLRHPTFNQIFQQTRPSVRPK